MEEDKLGSDGIGGDGVYVVCACRYASSAPAVLLLLSRRAAAPPDGNCDENGDWADIDDDPMSSAPCLLNTASDRSEAYSAMFASIRRLRCPHVRSHFFVSPTQVKVSGSRSRLFKQHGFHR